MTTTDTSKHQRAPNFLGPLRPADNEELTAFAHFCQSTGKSRRTIATYLEAVEQLAAFAAARGMPALTALRREHVEDFIGYLRARGNKPATVRNRYASLRVFYAWCQREDIRTDHPMARMEFPKVPEQVLPHYTDEEIRKLLAAIPTKARERTTLDRTYRDRALILFLLDTGVRCQELCDLRVGDLDRPSRRATVRAGKGGKGRIVAYSPDVASALHAYMRRRGGWEAVGPAAPLFAMRDGRPFRPNGIRMLMQRRFAAAGVEYRGTHAFRRAAGIAFLDAGGHPDALKELMGWTSWSMVHKYTKATAVERALNAHDEFSPVRRLLHPGRGG